MALKISPARISPALGRPKLWAGLLTYSENDPMALSQQQLDDAFATLVVAAIAGQRCPVAAREGVLGLPSGVTGKLARDGKIKVEVYAKNYRVVEILVGPHAGKRTKAPPSIDWKPYRVIDKSMVSGQPREQERKFVEIIEPRPRSDAAPRHYHSNFEPT